MRNIVRDLLQEKPKTFERDAGKRTPYPIQNDFRSGPVGVSYTIWSQHRIQTLYFFNPGRSK